MKTNLAWRFIVIFIVAIGAGLIAWYFPPTLGIDLAGGVSQVYELDLSKLQGTSESPGVIAGQVIEVLKKRIDPQGVRNIVWRVVGGKRIQIEMPLASDETRQARKAQVDAEEALQKSIPRPGDLEIAFHKSGAERTAILERFAPKDSDQLKALEALGQAYDKLQAANDVLAKLPVGTANPDQLDAQFNGRKDYDAQLSAVMEKYVNLDALKRVMDAADDEGNKTAQGDLEAFPKKYPLQQKLIENYIAAHKNLMRLSGGGIDDPAELQRLITKAGVLDFPDHGESDRIGGGLRARNYQNALHSLAEHGPDQSITVGGIHARWFQIDQNSKDNFADRGSGRPSSGYVISTWEGDWYLLAYDDIGSGHPATAHSLTHNDPDRKPWSVRAETPYTEPTGELALPFHPDAVGATYMGQLTDTYRGHLMSILLDDKAISAPRINGVITDSGVITFGLASTEHPSSAIQKEANQLKEIMDSGSLPAALQPEPISVENISSEMGSDNISAGKRSAYVAPVVVAVVAFMCLYYTITGVFADLALMLNLALVLASMSLLHATFTLPGIAGLVLTLGMAVDANVLINERIREEIHRGASLWMAIKLGYDKVFWTIFDANLTCSLTSIVLIYVGSEEVKGFGVTLLIGLIIHMFTALFVTRTMMMAAVKWGVVKAIDDHSIAEYVKELVTFTWLRNGHWPFMRVITVSNIDWIGKRYIFWGISAVVMIAGIVAFPGPRGEDKYDIEFRGGTQITFQLIQPKDSSKSIPTIDQVRKRIEGLATKAGLADLADARVYTVGDEKDHRFQMQTTIANTEKQNIKEVLLQPLADEFNDELNTQPAVKVDSLQVKDPRELQNSGIAMPVTATSLDQVFAKAGINDMPAADVTAYYPGGVAFRLDNITPPQTAAAIATRIKSTSTSPEFQDLPSRTFEILPITAVGANGKAEPASPDETRPLTRAVLVTSDPAHPYDDNNEATETAWRTRLVGPEWQLISVSLSTPKLFDGVTSFDAVVASEAKGQAVIAIVLSLVLIVIYVWIRFGGISYGVGAILSLVHDAIVAVAATVLSGVVYNHVFHKNPILLLSDFKINLTMIAAYLTIIGYSVNDTIVIFDRVRELRGKAHVPLSPKLINDAINQCFGRTIWTTFTVFIVVAILYIWGGQGVHGFAFAMLIGVITGAYSTLAIASPMLLTTGAGVQQTGDGENPFQRKDSSSKTRPGIEPAV